MVKVVVNSAIQHLCLPGELRLMVHPTIPQFSHQPLPAPWVANQDASHTKYIAYSHIYLHLYMGSLVTASVALAMAACVCGASSCSHRDMFHPSGIGTLGGHSRKGLPGRQAVTIGPTSSGNKFTLRDSWPDHNLRICLTKRRFIDGIVRFRSEKAQNRANRCWLRHSFGGQWLQMDSRQQAAIARHHRWTQGSRPLLLVTTDGLKAAGRYCLSPQMDSRQQAAIARHLSKHS